MKWLDKLERKFGKYAIHNLMYYIIILYILGLVIQMVNPSLYTQWLGLDAEAILHGQIWRIVTFIIQPPNASFLFMAFALYFYYMVGQALEYMWGAFRFNLYFFSGVLLHVLACLVIYLIFGINFSMGTFYLNLSLFFVYAYLFPDATFLLFFIFPIKAKWLGIIEGIFYGLTIIGGLSALVNPSLMFTMLAMGIPAIPANSIAALISLLNFAIFVMGSKRNRFSPKDIKRRRTYAKKVKAASQGTHHRCAICGRTEKDGEDLEFRFCSKCKGNYEYCQEHLFTHEHRK